MNKPRQRFSVTLTCAAILILCQIISIMASPASAREFQQALPGFKFSFPRDHGSHEDYKSEWWYYTGHLLSNDNRRFGYELTFFRRGVADSLESKTPWDVKDIYLAHFAISDESGKKFKFFEKLNRSGLAAAGASVDHYDVYNEGWSIEQIGNQFILRADADGCSLHLVLDSNKPPVVHGVDGVSQKASCKGCASHYYSMTRLRSQGYLNLNGATMKVAGVSWMDHEFGSNQLTKEQVGWDWYSIQLDNNCELMLYLMRKSGGGYDTNSSGTFVYPDGSTKHLTLPEFQISSKKIWKSAKKNGNYPLDWTIKIPQMKLELSVTSAFDDQELDTKKSTGVAYWEGCGHVSGTVDGKKVTGQSYVELTGYGEKFRKDI